MTIEEEQYQARAKGVGRKLLQVYLEWITEEAERQNRPAELTLLEDLQAVDPVLSALLERNTPVHKQLVYRFDSPAGELQYYPESYVAVSPLLMENSRVHLTYMRGNLLEELMLHPHRIVTHSRIGMIFWDSSQLDKGQLASIKVQVEYLRKDLGDTPVGGHSLKRQLIHTIRSRGYSLTNPTS